MNPPLIETTILNNDGAYVPLHLLFCELCGAFIYATMNTRLSHPKQCEECRGKEGGR